MARFARIDLQIRANRLILLNRQFRVPELNPLLFFFSDRTSGGLKKCELRVWGDSRESLACYENRGSSANRFARIDLRESPRVALRSAMPSKLWPSHGSSAPLSHGTAVPPNGCFEPLPGLYDSECYWSQNDYPHNFYFQNCFSNCMHSSLHKKELSRSFV